MRCSNSVKIGWQVILEVFPPLNRSIYNFLVTVSVGCHLFPLKFEYQPHSSSFIPVNNIYSTIETHFFVLFLTFACENVISNKSTQLTTTDHAKNQQQKIPKKNYMQTCFYSAWWANRRTTKPCCAICFRFVYWHQLKYVKKMFPPYAMQERQKQNMCVWCVLLFFSHIKMQLLQFQSNWAHVAHFASIFFCCSLALLFVRPFCIWKNGQSIPIRRPWNKFILSLLLFFIFICVIIMVRNIVADAFWRVF